MNISDYINKLELLKQQLKVINADFLREHIEGTLKHEWVTYRDPDKDWFLKEYIPVLSDTAKSLIGSIQHNQHYLIMHSDIQDKYLNRLFESSLVREENVPYDKETDQQSLAAYIAKWKVEIPQNYSKEEHVKVFLWDILRLERDNRIRRDVEQYAKRIFDIPESYLFSEFTCEGMCFEIINYSVPQVKLKAITGIFGNLTHYRSNNPILPDQEKIEIPNKLYSYWIGNFYITEIGKGVFDNLKNCKLLTLPKSIRHIEWGFWNCINLERIEVLHKSWENPYYKSVDGVLYSGDGTILCAYPNAHGEVYTVPEGVTTIGKFAFKSCNKIRELTLPSTMKKIEVNAFYRCLNLKIIKCKCSKDSFEFDGYIGDAKNVNPEWLFL